MREAGFKVRSEGLEFFEGGFAGDGDGAVWRENLL